MLAGVGGAPRSGAAMGGHLYAPETSTVLLGHLLRGVLTIGIASAAAALSASAASAAIVALTITLGTWALDYVGGGARRTDRRRGGVHAVRGAARVRAR